MSLVKRVALGFTLLLLVLVAVIAWKLRSRAEAIPEQLPAIDTTLYDPKTMVIPGTGGLPDFKLADHRGKTLYLVVEDRESIQARESTNLQRALNRWVFPPDVAGYQIGDVDGFAILQGKIEEFVAIMRPEMRIPLYMDYQGVFLKTFKLARGHVGVVVVDPAGEVVLRHSGPAEPVFLTELRDLLRAREPERDPAPAFKLSGVVEGPDHAVIDNDACKGRACLLLFLDEPVKRADIPGIKGGFDKSVTEDGIQARKPGVRLAALAAAADEKLDDKKTLAVLVGATEGLDLKHWRQLPVPAESREAEARAAFQIPPDQAALVLIDPEGRLAMKEVGLVQYYKFGLVSDTIAVDLGDHTEP